MSFIKPGSIFSIACIAAACTDASTTPSGESLIAPPVGRLRVAGPEIIAPDGNAIQLRGYNWGEWNTWVLPDDAKNNVADGANVVRIPLRWWGQWRDGVDSYDPNSASFIDQQHLDDLDLAIQAAAKQHLWVVLFVDSNYGQGSPKIAPSNANFWNAPAMRDRFKTVWTTLAQKYKDQPWLGAFEILPEPRADGVDDRAVREFYDELIGTIRNVDHRTPIIVGSNDAYSPAHLEGAFPAADDNVIYTCDYWIYDQGRGDFTNRIHYLDDFGKHGAPVWINQVSVDTGDGSDGYLVEKQSVTTVLGEFAARGIGWTWWTYREASKDPTHHGIYYYDANGNWQPKGDWRQFIADIFVR